MKKVRFIYNPLSGFGAGTISSNLKDIEAVYATRGLDLEVRQLDFDAHPSTLLDGLDPETFDHLLIAGGDGTINFVVNELIAQKIDMPVAFIPSGTANDFATTIGMARDPLEACRQILSGTVRRVDLGCVNGDCFVNVFSFGLFTNVSQHTPTAWKNAIGKAAYIMGGMTELMHIHSIPVNITSDGGDFDGNALIVLAFNGKSAGNFKLASMAEVDDGYLDVLVLQSGTMPAVTTVQAFLHYLFGGLGELPKDVLHIRCRHMRIVSSADEPTDVDGQPGPRLPVELECRAAAIRVIMPDKLK